MFGKKDFKLDPEMGLLALVESTLTGEIELPSVGRVAKQPKDSTVHEMPGRAILILRLLDALGKEHEAMHEYMRRHDSSERTPRHLQIHAWGPALRDIFFAELHDLCPEDDRELTVISGSKVAISNQRIQNHLLADLGPLAALMALSGGMGVMEIQVGTHRCE